MADIYFAATNEQIDMVCDGLRRHFHHVHFGQRTYSYDYSWYLQDEKTVVGYDANEDALVEHIFVGTDAEVAWFRDTFPDLTYDY